MLSPPCTPTKFSFNIVILISLFFLFVNKHIILLITVVEYEIVKFVYLNETITEFNNNFSIIDILSKQRCPLIKQRSYLQNVQIQS